MKWVVAILQSVDLKNDSFESKHWSYIKTPNMLLDHGGEERIFLLFKLSAS